MRKHLGGGMRQAGIIAAAGIVALETMVERLSEDHARARVLTDGLRKIPGIRLDPGTPATNMIFFTLAETVRLSTAQIETKLEERGILAHSSGPRRFRLVTHFGIGDHDVEQTIAAFQEIFQ